MTAPAEVLDILHEFVPGHEPSTELDGPRSGLPTPTALYNRWEQQQWSVADVNVERDILLWKNLSAYGKRELTDTLTELEVGEVCVTRTLSALVDHAPAEQDRIYLCTQMADEGRHVRFFQEYLTVAAGFAVDDNLRAGSAYGQLFEPRLVTCTSQVRADGADPASWYTALVHYHLITEGVLAAAALRTTRALAKRFALPALEEGLTNVARDESRHLTYGLVAARSGVESGYRNVIVESYLAGVELAATVIVNPYKRAVAPVLRIALNTRAAQVSAQWALAHDRAIRQLRLIGLTDIRKDVSAAWESAKRRALDEYRQRWGVDHPVLLAAA